MAKRLKVKKGLYYIIVAIIILVVGAIFGFKKYEEYKYHQTYEYKLLEHGYNEEEVKTILNEFKIDEEINFFLTEKVNKNYVNITKEKYYLKKNFSKYINYMNENKKYDLKTVVRNINIHLDQKFYEANLTADISKDTSMLVNKSYLLSSDYEPDDLVTISQNYSWGDLGSKKIRKVAYDAFLDMWNAANEAGYYLMVNSAYRSYQDQERVYNDYKNSRGEKYADSIAARPGASEHQTGLALDIFSKTNSNKNTFKDSETAAWLKNNAHNYGFILRYPEGLENITGYNFEAWHFRYVGIDLATAIYNENITFEEYYAWKLEK